MHYKLLVIFSLLSSVAYGQDGRPVREPNLPPVCEVIGAPLRVDADGPLVGGTPAAEDAESARQALRIQRALRRCPARHAVRLSRGATPAHTAFLIDPITLPAHRSLIVDGGVTVFASRNPANYQVRDTGKVCGEVGKGYPVHGVCHPLIGLRAGSGLYGYGVLDGQGHRQLIRNGAFVDHAWWDLLVVKSRCPAADACEQASPHMVYGSAKETESPLTDLTVYGVTVRNPPFHTIRLGGRGITAWGVKVQAPWNVPNSDGLDIDGTNILLRDIMVANGDQNVAISSVKDRLTTNLTIERATFYGKGGVALLGNGRGITNVLVRDMAMTGTTVSVAPGPDGSMLVNGRDPTRMHLRHARGRLPHYRLALPSIARQAAMQLNFNMQPGVQSFGPRFETVAFEQVCLQDIDDPITIGPLNDFAKQTPGSAMPVVENVFFRDVRALAPTQHFRQGRGNGTYALTFVAHPSKRFYNRFALANVVFDRTAQGQPSLGAVVARGNLLRTVDNVFPARLNRLDGPRMHNRYSQRTKVSRQALAISCPKERWSFLAGDLYLSRSDDDGSADQALTILSGESVTLNAVLQPAMSQTTWFHPGYMGNDPGALAIGAPALTKDVEFYEGAELVGRGRLGANGTLATVTIAAVPRGSHVYRAHYPGDRFYAAFDFGSVVLTAK